MAVPNPARKLAPSRRIEKSPGAFRTISEVAEELDVPQHVLRFWETKFPQVRPLKRGGGRRYYRPEDVDLLRRIRRLLYQEGYTIKGVQRLLREGGLRHEVSTTAETIEEPAPGIAAEMNRDRLESLLEDLQEMRAMVEDIRRRLS
ncbi:MAG TPA: MerR family transcriptional regulator [Alphaproteobacteria bacterium]|nr:MerR family transcriptional regulator [Alphaproteobacteria bacterium]